jgi:hypothetical protein
MNPAWVTYSPLLPLALLLFTGLYLFLLPYAISGGADEEPHKLEVEPWRQNERQSGCSTWRIGARRHWPACGR